MRLRLNLLITALLVIVTGVSLLSNLPQASALADTAGLALLYAALTAFSLAMSVLLSEGEISAAYVIGMVAFLSQPSETQPLMMWAIFVGGAAGGVVLARRTEPHLPRRLTVRSLRSVALMGVRVTLSMVVAGQVYLAADGVLPLAHPLRANALPLLFFALAYVLVYLAIFVLESYADGVAVQRMLRDNLGVLFTLLILPAPFGVLSALVVVTEPASLAIFVVGALLVSLGVYGLSRAHYQLRKQVDELRSLALLGEALHNPTGGWTHSCAPCMTR